MTGELQKLILEKTGLRLGINKISELARLVYEIGRREKTGPETLLDGPEISAILKKTGSGYLAKFAGIKKYLIGKRYPNASRVGGEIYFSRLKDRPRGARLYGEPFIPEHIFIEEAAAAYPIAERARGLYPGVKCQTIESLKSYAKSAPASALDPKKRDIFVALQKWDFVKPCPCTQNVVNCGYHIINLGFGCPFDCSYCYLQQYSNFPGIIIDANINDYLQKIKDYLNKYPVKRIRVGTGEFSDSLALDGITGYAKELVEFFSDKKAVLELKTKSANIEGFIGARHGGNTVVSWSLNPEKIVEAEELGAASLTERLKAAKTCVSAGFGVGFHFDPVIFYNGWENDYEAVVNRLFDSVKDPAWISIGALRFHRALKDVIEQRFPESDYIYGELFLGADKKMRYYPELRRGIFDKMNGFIKARNNKTLVYLCMEGPEMWREVLGRTKPGFN